MGMYTELNIAIEIDDDPQVISILQYMLDVDDGFEPKLPHHAFFYTACWRWMLRSDSYYFPGQTDSRLVKDNLYPDRPMWFLTVRCNLKNYSNEIEEFLDWLAPYSLTQGFVGYKRYEEDENPTLIYIDGDRVIYK